MITIFIRWFVFTVVIALLPICFSYVHKVTYRQANQEQPSIEGLVAHGELLLITVALAADAVGSLVVTGKNKSRVKLVAGGGCFVSVVFASFYFADVSVQDTIKADTDVFFWMSITLFILTLISAGTCKILTEKTGK